MSDYKIIDVSDYSYTVNYEDYYFTFHVPISDDLSFIDSKKKIDRELVLKDHDTYFYLRGIYIKYRIDKNDKMLVHGNFNVYKKFEDVDEFTKDLI